MKMASERNSMIRVPEGSDRDPFADREAVLRLMSFGACGVVDLLAPSDAGEPPAPTDTVEPTASRSDSPVENTAMIGGAKTAAASGSGRPA